MVIKNLTAKLIIILMVVNQLNGDNLNNIWNEARGILHELNVQFKEAQVVYDQLYVTPGWRECQNNITNLIMGFPNPDFLHNGTITMTMLRERYNYIQMYESNYLRFFLSEPMKKLIAKFRDTTVGGVKLEVSQLNCSANALGQLYVLAKVLEQSKDANLETILEWGGGYGALARITKNLLPDIKYLVVDLVPLLALQYLYLRLNFPAEIIHVHKTAPLNLEPKGIHLIPLYLIKNSDIKVDAFISAFGLSECPYAIQQVVIDHNFFDPSIIYLSGIINDLFDDSGSRCNLVHKSHILKQLQNNFSTISLSPHHIMEPNMCHFELLAYN